MSTGQIGHRLFDLQPTGCDISLRACQWAVAVAEGILGRTLLSADLDGLGSRLSVPLLLLASTRTKKAFKWPLARRWFVGNELLKRLREEARPAVRDHCLGCGGQLDSLLVCSPGSMRRRMLGMRGQAGEAGGAT